MNPEDRYGRKINVGDIVIFNPPHVKGIYEGTVQKLYPKSVQVNWKYVPTKYTATYGEKELSARTCKVHSKDCVLMFTTSPC